MKIFKSKLAIAIILLISATLTTGCMGNSSAGTISEFHEANEKAHDAAELQLCKGYVLGIAPLRYRSEVELLQAWQTICAANLKRRTEPTATNVE